jgi:hypothetical protein
MHILYPSISLKAYFYEHYLFYHTAVGPSQYAGVSSFSVAAKQAAYTSACPHIGYV